MARIYTLFAAITPSDTEPPASFPVNGIYCAGTGNLAVRDIRGVTTTFTAVPTGAVLPIAPQLVLATGTTGTWIALGDTPSKSF